MVAPALAGASHSVSSSNPVQHQRTRHIEIDIHFVRERVAVGDLLCPPCATSSQYMDIFTKGLLFALHRVQVSLNVCGG